MVRQTIDAVYENGVLRPLTPLTGVPEHGAVRLTVMVAIAGGEARRPLSNCVGILPDADAQEMRSAIEREFEGVDAGTARRRVAGLI
jgi:hypothetical protein